jgi:hypothetical protein
MRGKEALVALIKWLWSNAIYLSEKTKISYVQKNEINGLKIQKLDLGGVLVVSIIFLILPMLVISSLPHSICNDNNNTKNLCYSDENLGSVYFTNIIFVLIFLSIFVFASQSFIGKQSLKQERNNLLRFLLNLTLFFDILAPLAIFLFSKFAKGLIFWDWSINLAVLGSILGIILSLSAIYKLLGRVGKNVIYLMILVFTSVLIYLIITQAFNPIIYKTQGGDLYKSNAVFTTDVTKDNSVINITLFGDEFVSLKSMNRTDLIQIANKTGFNYLTAEVYPYRFLINFSSSIVLYKLLIVFFLFIFSIRSSVSDISSIPFTEFDIEKKDELLGQFVKISGVVLGIRNKDSKPVYVIRTEKNVEITLYTDRKDSILWFDKKLM